MALEEEQVNTPAEAAGGEGNTAEATPDLESQIAAERQRAEEYLQHWQRTQADFINYKRRAEQEREQLSKYANTKLLLTLLPVLDNFERAFAVLPDDLAKSSWIDGVRSIERGLRATFDKEGVTPIDALGQDFDPEKHEALLQEDAGPENKGKVITELQKGYMLHDRLLRPSLVKVGE